MWDIKSELNSILPRRVGILGGTFDPVHTGHLIMAQDAMERFDLDEVCLLPCASPPHKRGRQIAQSRHRVSMIEAAIAGDLRLSLSLLELDRGETSYTVDSMAEITAACPETEFFFIIGGDSLFELYSWKEIDKLLEICSFITVARPRFSFDNLCPEKLRLSGEQVASLREGIMVGHEIDISSTDIRSRVAEGLSIKYLVPDEVGNYIAEHNIYRGL